MSLTKRSHYVPDFYLKSFAIPGTNPLCITVQEVCGDGVRIGQTTNEAVETHLYRIRQKDGEDDHSLEKSFSKIEWKASAVIRKIDERCEVGDLSPEEGADFAMFVGSMIVRTPQYFESVSVMFERLKNLVEKIKNGTATPEEIGDRSEEKINGLISDAERGAFTDENIVSQVGQYHISGTIASNFAKIILEKMYWVIARAEPNEFYCTCDDPVLTWSESRNLWRQSLGNEDAEVIFPLSPKTCFLASRNQKIKKRSTEVINNLVVWQAYKYVYSSRKDGINLDSRREAEKILPRTEALNRLGKM